MFKWQKAATSSFAITFGWHGWIAANIYRLTTTIAFHGAVVLFSPAGSCENVFEEGFLAAFQVIHASSTSLGPQISSSLSWNKPNEVGFGMKKELLGNQT